MVELKWQQAKFVAGYLEHGDVERAYVEAGYQGEARVGAAHLMKRPSVQAALSQAGEAILGAAIEVAKEQTRDRLQSREGLSEWLCSVVRGGVEEDYVDKEGNTYERPACLKDRIAAAKLLAQIQGMLVQKVELSGEVKGAILLVPDNGRSQVPIPATVQVLKSGPQTR